MIPGNCPYLCVWKPIFWSFCIETRGHECSVASRVLSSFGTREFPTMRLSETTNACWKGQSLVGNNKNLSETTNACRKGQSFVGNNKRLLETTNACWKQQSIVGKFIINWVYHFATCLVGIKTTSICLSVFVGFLWYCSTKMESRLDILAKIVLKTTKLCQKRQTLVRNKKGLSETALRAK